MHWGRFSTALLIVILVFAMSACGNTPDSETASDSAEHSDNHEGHDPDASPSSPEVKLTLPEDAKAGKEVSIQITVTHEGEPVNDADEVQFEIWEKGAPEDEHEMIDAEKTGDGVYSVKKTFQDPGEYKMMYHVTARGSHVMEPAETLVVR